MKYISRCKRPDTLFAKKKTILLFFFNLLDFFMTTFTINQILFSQKGALKPKSKKLYYVISNLLLLLHNSLQSKLFSERKRNLLKVYI